MKNSESKNHTTTVLSLILKLIEPKNIDGFFSNFTLALPRILGGFFLATMFGGSKFGVPWSISDNDLGLFEVAAWFPEDVANFGFPFSVAPLFFAWIGAASEAIGGMFLLLGLQTRISGFLITCTMLVAIFLQQWGGPVWNMLPALGFLWIGLYATVFGSGKFGLDYIIAKKMKKGINQHPSMKTPLTTVLIIAISLLASTGSQAQIRGNGQIITSDVEVESFSSIDNGLSSDINVRIGTESEVKITIDENLIDHVELRTVNGKLIIDQKEWISASKKINIEITTPSVEEFKNSAYGTYYITELMADEFVVNSPVGDVFLSGDINKLTINTKVGDIDATKVNANSVKVEITSYGTVKVHAVEQLDADVSKNGKVVYMDEPEILRTKIKEGGQVITTQENNAPAKEVVYINVKLKNNSSNRVNIVIEGPENARFGYGAPFGRFQSRNERFPVGTRIYLERTLRANQLLLEIKEENAGKTVNLF